MGLFSNKSGASTEAFVSARDAKLRQSQADFGGAGSATFDPRSGQISSTIDPRLEAFRGNLTGGLAQSGGLPIGMGQQLFGGVQGVGQDVAQGLGNLGIAGTNPFDPNRGIQRALRGSALGRISGLEQDIGARADERLGLLREQARPFEQQAAGQLNQQLFGTGQGAVTGSADLALGGGRLAQAFGRGLGQADVGRQIAARDFALSERDQESALLQQAVGLGSGLQAQNFGQGLQAGQFNQNLLQNIFGIQQGVGQFGLQAGQFQQGAQQSAINQLGSLQGNQLALFNAALQSEVARSNAQLGVAGQQGSVAQQQQGGFLQDVVKGAVGGFASGFASR